MIRNKFFPHWLIHHAFGRKSRTLSLARLFLGIFDVHLCIWRGKFYQKLLCSNDNKPLLGHIHIPKTGGTYLLSRQSILPYVNFSHVVVRTDRSDKYCPVGLIPINPNKVSGYFLFANVRHPLSFLVSYYHHVKGFDNYRNPRHYDYPFVERGFEFLVETIINRTDKWPSRKFLFPQLFNQDGTCLVNWVNRNEFLDSDMDNLAKHFGFLFKAGRKKRVAPKRKPFDAYYSESLLEKICGIYSREMALFGYAGAGITSPLIKLKPLEKNRNRYDYLEDKFYLDNKLLKRLH